MTELAPVTISASTDALLILTQGGRSIVVHRLQVPFLLHQIQSLMNPSEPVSPVVDPDEMDICGPVSKGIIPGKVKPLLGVMELRQIPNLKLNKPEDLPTWLACLNEVGVADLTRAATVIAKDGGVGWCSVVCPLAYRLHKERTEPSATRAVEELPDDLNTLPDGHPLKPRKGTQS
jgi:hypothetical protein